MMSSRCCVQVPLRKGHVDRLRAEEKWQSRARLTETSFSFLESQKAEGQRGAESAESQQEEEDWHFERPHVRRAGVLKG